MTLSRTQLFVLQRMREHYTFVYLRSTNRAKLLRNDRADILVRLPTVYALMDRELITIEDDDKERTLFKMTADGEAVLSKWRPF